MPRQIYPGQFKFRIFTKQPKQSKLAKRKVEQTKPAVLAKRRADTQKRMLNLRERHLQQQQNNSILAEQLTATWAIERYNK